MLEVLARVPESLFWSTPPEVDSEFTAEDPLALDYLGQQVGNWMFPGFTTRTGRAQYYAVVLYGLKLVDRAIAEYGYPGNDDTRIRLFERWERFWALATFEAHDGQLERGDPDTMRGVRGVKRTWTRGTKPLPLDFTMISRQSELAGLGAYLSSLRHHRLVGAGSLRPTLAAEQLIKLFWSEAKPPNRSHLYERYALSALDLGRSTIARESGVVKLANVGHKTRLTAIQSAQRAAARDLLWHVLFEDTHDPTTLPLARQVIAANQNARDPKPLLEGMVAGRWQPALGDEQRELVELALTFGELAVSLLAHFNRMYGRIVEAGFIANADAVAQAVFAEPETAVLRRCCARLLEHPGRRRFRELGYHGRPLLKLCAQLASSDPMTCLEALLAYHREVQRSRRGGGAWIRPEPPKLTILIGHYNGYKDEPRFPDFKLWVVQRLLQDLGKLP